MKKIIYISLSILTFGLFSCSDDDSYSIAYVDDEVKTPLVGSITLNRTSAAPGTMVSFNYTLPQSFDVESTIEISATTSYDLLAIKAITEKSYVKVPAGQTTGTGMFKMPGPSDFAPGVYAGISNHTTASITGIALTQPPREDEDGIAIDPYIPLDDPFTMTSESVSLTGLDVHDPFMFPNLDDDDEPLPTLMVSLDWEGPWDLNDLDMYIFDDPFTNVFEVAESGSRFEGDFFNNPANESHPDGDYIVEVAIWTSADSNPIPCRLTLTHPDGSADVFEYSVDPAVGFIDAVGFTKSTDGSGNVTYTTYSLL